MSAQCLGKSKKNELRCEKRTNSTNGYCHNHQDQAAGGKVGPSDTKQGRESKTPVVWPATGPGHCFNLVTYMSTVTVTAS